MSGHDPDAALLEIVRQFREGGAPLTPLEKKLARVALEAGSDNRITDQEEEL